VGETTASAHRIMRGAFLEFLERRAPDLRAYLARTFGPAGLYFDFLAEEIAVFGDAEHCAARLLELGAVAGVEHVLCTFNLITLDHRHCVESMQRFASDVVPRVRRGAPSAPRLDGSNHRTNPRPEAA
jgi:hypothetical protein